MPVTCEISDDIITLQMTGIYEMSEIEAALLKALDDPRASRAIGLLFDVSQSESLKKRRAQDVSAMGYFLASHSRRFGGRIALVGSEDFSFGMMRAGNVVLEQQTVQSEVFRDEIEAREWLHGRA